MRHLKQHSALGFVQLSGNSVCASFIAREVNFPVGGLFFGEAKIGNQKREEVEGEDGTKEGHPFHGNLFLAKGFEVMLPE
jgi:hypothetical protein